MGVLCYSVCKVIVLSLDQVGNLDDGWDQGLVWEDSRVGEAQLSCLGPVDLDTEPWSIYARDAYVQDRLCVELQQSPGLYAGVGTPGQRISRLDSA